MPSLRLLWVLLPVLGGAILRASALTFDRLRRAARPPTPPGASSTLDHLGSPSRPRMSARIKLCTRDVVDVDEAGASPTLA